MAPYSAEGRKRVCVICSAPFVAQRPSSTTETCSKPCQGAKRSASLKAVHADPDFNARWKAAHADALARWHSNPDNARAFAKRMSERMKRRHTEPEFQEQRDKRSSAIMKKNWENHRESFVAQAVQRHIDNHEAGKGLWDPDALARKNAASKWIMKQANDAMRSETNYVEVYAEVQERLRREMPYDGPQDGSEYMDYLRQLGTAVASSPECREIADTFLSAAIPRFAAQYQADKIKPRTETA